MKIKILIIITIVIIINSAFSSLSINCTTENMDVKVKLCTYLRPPVKEDYKDIENLLRKAAASEEKKAKRMYNDEKKLEEKAEEIALKDRLFLDTNDLKNAILSKQGELKRLYQSSQKLTDALSTLMEIYDLIAKLPDLEIFLKVANTIVTYEPAKLYYYLIIFKPDIEEMCDLVDNYGCSVALMRVLENQVKRCLIPRMAANYAFFDISDSPFIVIIQSDITRKAFRKIKEAVKLIKDSHWYDKRPECFSQTILISTDEEEDGPAGSTRSHMYENRVRLNIGFLQKKPVLEIAGVIIHENFHRHILRSRGKELEELKDEEEFTIQHPFVGHSGYGYPSSLLEELYAYIEGYEFILDVWDSFGFQAHHENLSLLAEIEVDSVLIERGIKRLKKKKYSYLQNYLEEVETRWKILSFQIAAYLEKFSLQRKNRILDRLSNPTNVDIAL